MPRCALPDHIDEAKEWKGTDWDNWFQRPLLKIKHWFAFGPRCPQGWTISALLIPVRKRWRELPCVVYARRGRGAWRWERTDGPLEYKDDLRFRLRWSTPHTIETLGGSTPAYLSAIQYWVKWHVQLQWPLFFACSYTFGEPTAFPNRPAEGSKTFYMRIGARRDADRVYWWPSFFIGIGWN